MSEEDKNKERILTPQQEEFLALYTDPRSPLFGNALQSALKAGYSQEYSENITHRMPDWLAENVGDMKRLRKAEKNLDEVQGLQIYDDEGKVDVNVIRERTKVDTFLAERLNKAKYSTRKEFTGRDGDPIELAITRKEEIEKAINDVI